MNALIVLSALVAAAQAGFVAPGLVNPLQYASPFYANNYGYAAVSAAPVAALPGLYNAALPAPVATPLAAPIAGAVIPDPNPSSQYHSQDEFGNVNHGYANRNSAKQEAGNVYGGVVGSYQYIDANGVLQRTDYIADAAGFRVKASNLPVAPTFNLAAPVFTGVAPAPVEETPEVKAAKAEFLAKFEEAKSRTKRSIISPYALNFGYAQNYPYALNYPYAAIQGYNGLLNANVYAAGAISAPVAALPGAYNAAPVAAGVTAAPASREAVLTKVKLNPGHALFYRVD